MMEVIKGFLCVWMLSMILYLEIVHSQDITSSTTSNVQRIFQESTEDPDHDHDHDHDHEHHEDDDDAVMMSKSADIKTWLFASVSALIISLCGIFGVIIIPIMQKIFYQHLLQFLIALAIGTLSGDALLHLLPHALLPHHEDDHHNDHGDHEEHVQHDRAVWVGLVAAGAVIIFYFFEKIINIMQAWRSRRKTSQSKMNNNDDDLKKEKPPRVVREGHEVSERVVGENVCIKKYSNYCVADLEENSEAPGRGWSRDTSRDNTDDDDHKKKHEQQTVIISQHEVGWDFIRNLINITFIVRFLTMVTVMPTLMFTLLLGVSPVWRGW